MEGRKEHSFILCLRNEGAISDMPMDASVEIPVSVCKRGLAPRKPGALPRTVSGVIQAVKESERLTIEAVVHKSYDSALQALAVHPLVSSIGKARQYLDQVVKEEGIELH
jgi:6-phospho-beta-glucosidase